MTEPCMYCGSTVEHIGLCPKIKSIEYTDDGKVKKIEFFSINEMMPQWMPQTSQIPLAPSPFPAWSGGGGTQALPLPLTGSPAPIYVAQSDPNGIIPDYVGIADDLEKYRTSLLN